MIRPSLKFGRAIDLAVGFVQHQGVTIGAEDASVLAPKQVFLDFSIELKGFHKGSG